MARRSYPRRIVEKTPSHDGKPSFTAWTMSERQPDNQTPPDETNRPKFSLQIYDTASAAGDPEHVSVLAKEMYENTRDRLGIGRESPDRVEVHGLPLSKDTPDEDRIQQCLEHYEAEVKARYEARSDFLMPPTFDRFWWWRRVIVIARSEPVWEAYEVRFDKKPPPEPPLDGYDEEDTFDPPDWEARPFAREELAGRLGNMRARCERFYYNVTDGRLNELWDWDVVNYYYSSYYHYKYSLGPTVTEVFELDSTVCNNEGDFPGPGDVDPETVGWFARWPTKDSDKLEETPRDFHGIKYR